MVGVQQLQILKIGLALAGLFPDEIENASNAFCIKTFKVFYGLHPLVVTRIWNDLEGIDQERKLKYYFMTLHWLRHYPVEGILATTFKTKDYDTVRMWSWYYAECIQVLSEDVIGFEAEDWNNGVVYFATVDGVHCKICEPSHPTKPYDSTFYSEKHGSAGLSYQLLLSTTRQRLLAIHRPFPAGHNDRLIYQMTLAGTLPPNKRIVADKAYTNEDGVSTPNANFDSKLANQFKRRVRARHETFNGRLKEFKILDYRFRTTTNKLFLHHRAFEACCVLVSYQIQLTNPLMES